MKALFVIGTRPEAIKIKPVVDEMTTALGITPLVASTGQQKDLLPAMTTALGTPPHFYPNESMQNGGIAGFLGASINFLGQVLRECKPDIVLVHGDTSTAMAGAIASFLENVPIAHIEAGLRTHDLEAPYPEEGFRQMIARIARFHFAPTSESRENLIREGVDEKKIIVTGNTIVDVVEKFLEARMKRTNEIIDERVDAQERYCVVTLHRRENHGERIDKALKVICEELGSSGFKVFVVSHPNPRVQESLNQIQQNKCQMSVIPPMPYEDFLELISGASLLITDSGGIQEEAVTLGVKALVVRDSTERPEGLKTGFLQLVGNDSENLRRAIKDFLRNEVNPSVLSKSARNPYGDGKASEIITKFLLNVKTDGELLIGQTPEQE